MNNILKAGKTNRGTNTHTCPRCDGMGSRRGAKEFRRKDYKGEIILGHGCINCGGLGVVEAPTETAE